ncbi:MAG: hypothetical protein ABI461_08520 [Polyangiaceae bacterium]
MVRSLRKGRWFGVEAISTLREAVAWPLDFNPVLPNANTHEQDVVVLVHGFLATAGVFRPLRRRLDSYGIHSATFTHLPGVGVQRIALSLAKLVDRIPRTARVHIVGHSLGGLVARWYVDELGGYSRVSQTISLASPFGGAHHATYFPYLVGADLHPESQLLARLRERARADVPHTSIIGSADKVVFPVQSAFFGHGERIVLRHRGHNTLLYDNEVARIVLDRVRRGVVKAA